MTLTARAIFVVIIHSWTCVRKTVWSFTITRIQRLTNPRTISWLRFTLRRCRQKLCTVSFQLVASDISPRIKTVRLLLTFLDAWLAPPALIFLAPTNPKRTYYWKYCVSHRAHPVAKKLDFDEGRLIFVTPRYQPTQVRWNVAGQHHHATPLPEGFCWHRTYASNPSEWLSRV